MTNEVFKTYGRDPIILFGQWLAEAEKSEINDPTAFCLATADKNGRPSARMVLMKELNNEGIKFHTNAESTKGNDIADNPFGALCMHWKSLRRQIRAEGRIVEVSEAESDAYFKTRPHGRQVGAWASQQSRPFSNQAELDDAVKYYEEKFAGESEIPRPLYWKGFRLKPERIEFWIGNKDRLHERFEYLLENGENEDSQSGLWTANWLYP